MLSSDSISILDIFPVETVERILGECRSIEDLISFAATCSEAKSTVLHFLRGKEGSTYLGSRYIPNYKASGVKTLYKEQVKAFLALKIYPEEDLFIRSPLGSGKTLMALMCAEESWNRCGTRTLIVVTPKCFTSWMDHLKMCNYKLVKCRPEKSDVLVCHSSSKNHRELIMRTTNEVLIEMPFYILLTTTHYIGGSNRARDYQRRLSQLSSVYTQIIADESHLINHETESFFAGFERRVYLSASPMNSTMYSRCIDLVDKRDKSNGSRVEMQYTFVPSTGRTGPLLRDLLTNVIRGNKVVLFTHWNPTGMKTGMTWLKLNVPGYRFIRFYNTSESSLAKFRASKEKSVLVTTILSASEGTNFEVADSAIYMDFGILIPERARQCFGRIRRRNNPNPVVQNYLIYDISDIRSYINTRFNLYHALDLRLEMSKKGGKTLTKICRSLSKQGISVQDLPKPEFVTIFGTNRSDTEVLPFKEEEYTLPFYQIMQCMNIV